MRGYGESSMLVLEGAHDKFQAVTTSNATLETSIRIAFIVNRIVFDVNHWTASAKIKLAKKQGSTVRPSLKLPAMRVMPSLRLTKKPGFLAPLSRKYLLAQAPPLPGARFARVQGLFVITLGRIEIWIADGDRGLWFMILRDRIFLANSAQIDAGHLMDLQSQIGGLQ